MRVRWVGVTRLENGRRDYAVYALPNGVKVCLRKSRAVAKTWYAESLEHLAVGRTARAALHAYRKLAAG